MEFKTTYKPRYKDGVVLKERYRVLRTIIGGMGEVVFCHDLKATEEKELVVVLKTYIHSALHNQDLHNRFIKEATAWLKLNPGPDNFILPLRDIIEIDHTPFLVMDHCSKGSLVAKLNKAPLQIEEAVLYGTEILIGLYIINDLNNMVHRDIKPGNILFDTKNNVKLADLGLIKFLSDITETLTGQNKLPFYKTETRAALGTLPYMAPEQLIDSSSVDSRVDIWAFGIVLFEMITGKLPFDGSKSEEIIEKIMYKKPEYIEEFKNKTTKKIGRILLRCLEKDKNKRYKKFIDLINDWDKIIKLKSSPPMKRIFAKDDRIEIENDIIEFHWWNIYPERMHDYKTTWVMPGFRALSEARKYYTLGNYEKAIESCEKLLGSRNDPASNYHLLLKGILSEDIPMRMERCDRVTKVIYTPPRLMVEEVIYYKMKILIDIIEGAMWEDRTKIVKFQDELVKMADEIVSNEYQNTNILNLCAQAFLFERELDKADKILYFLLEKDEMDLRSWFALMISAGLRGDPKKSEKVARYVIQNNRQKADHISQFACAKASALMHDWKNVVYFAGESLKYEPNDIGSLYILCLASMQLNEFENAKRYHNKMLNIDPNDAETKKIKYFIDQHEGNLTGEQIFKRCVDLASKGIPEEQYRLGLLYIRGEIIQKDIEEGINWIIKAAKQGYGDAIKFMNELGDQHKKGDE